MAWPPPCRRLVDTIRSLAPQEGEDGVEVFNRLMTGLESQLGGMGVAFASSLLGLAGSLVVGLLELFAGHGQNRFYRELEEWLSHHHTGRVFRRARVRAVAKQRCGRRDRPDGRADGERCNMMLIQSDVSRAMVTRKLGVLADTVERLTERMGDANPINTALMRVAEGQERP